MDPIHAMSLYRHAGEVSDIARELLRGKAPAPGRLLIRKLIAQVIGREAGGAREYALGRWGEAVANQIERASVPAFNIADNLTDSEGSFAGEVQAFFGGVLEQSILGKLSLRQVPPHTRVLSMESGATGYWVAEGKAVPMSWQSVAGSHLSLLKCAALICATKESLQAVGEVAENGLQQDLQRAVSMALDSAFIDAGNAGIAGQMPASVANGAILIPSAGTDPEDLRLDFQQLFDAYTGDVASAALIMHPRTALEISLLQQPLGNSDLKLTGGQLFGVPVVTSRGVPYSTSGGSITLVDQSAVAYATGGFELQQSDQASLEMADNTTTASAPVGGVVETTTVNLWQTNTVAFMSMLAANWQVQGEGRVIVLQDVSYGGIS